MRLSVAIPKGPVGFRVEFFGHDPKNGFPTVIAQVNLVPGLRFYKHLGKWFDYEDLMLDQEEQQMLEQVWTGEHRRLGIICEEEN